MGYLRFLNSTAVFPANIVERSDTRITIVFPELEEAVENTNGFEYAKDAAFKKVLGQFPTFQVIYDITGNQITYSNGEEPPVDPDHKQSLLERMEEITTAQTAIETEQKTIVNQQTALYKISEANTSNIETNSEDITVAQEALAELYEMIIGGEE